MKINQSTQRWLAMAMLVIGLVMIAAWGWQVGRLALSLRDRAARVQRMAADPKQIRLAVLAGEVHGARVELMELRGALVPLLWLGERLGGDLGIGRPLMDAAVESATAGDEALQALNPALGDFAPASFSMSAVPRVLDALAAARPALESASAHLDAADKAIDRIERPLSPRAEQLANKADQIVSLAQQGIGAALVAPGLLGQDGPRTYLVLAQNADELRPTGGFISSIGRVIISHGALITQTFQDSYAADDFSKPYPDPPWQLSQYMGLDLWVLRDANWSPDFPTAARDAVALYQISRPEPIYGVVGVSQRFIQTLIPALEPLGVEGLSAPLTSANAEQVLREAWDPVQGVDNSSWIQNRKKFIGATVRAMLERLTSGEVNWTRLGQAMLEAMPQRQVMVFSTGPEAADLASLRWDGAVRRDAPGDYMMLVDANLGYGKVNPLIDERVTYTVTLLPDGTGRAVVTVDYSHRGTQAGVVCTPDVPYDTSVTYDKMMQRCYYDYLRLMVPPGSRLQASTSHLVPGAYLHSRKTAIGGAQVLPDETGRSVFGQFFVVEYGQSLQTQIEYDLPRVVTTESGRQRYRLTLQKQPGTPILPIKVVLALPRGARLMAVNPRATIKPGGMLEYDLALGTDQHVEAIYILAH